MVVMILDFTIYNPLTTSINDPPTTSLHFLATLYKNTALQDLVVVVERRKKKKTAPL